MKIISKVLDVERKCPNCNWGMKRGFGLEDFKEEELICGDCFSAYLLAHEYEVKDRDVCFSWELCEGDFEQCCTDNRPDINFKEFWKEHGDEVIRTFERGFEWFVQDYGTAVNDAIDEHAPPCNHSWVDENNDGKEVCRFCGEANKDENPRC